MIDIMSNKKCIWTTLVLWEKISTNIHRNYMPKQLSRVIFIFSHNYIFFLLMPVNIKKGSLFLGGVVVVLLLLCQENERLLQDWLWRKHLLEQIKKGLTKMGKITSLLCPSSEQEVNCWNMDCAGGQNSME